MNNYYSKYKNIQKGLEKGKHLKQAGLAYLKKCDDHKLIPSPMGVVARKG